MSVNRDAVPGRCVDHPLVMSNGLLVVVAAVDPAQQKLGGVAGLDRVNPERLVPREGRLQVLVVVVDIAPGLVVRDVADAVVRCVPEYRGEIEVGLWSEEILVGSGAT